MMRKQHPFSNDDWIGEVNYRLGYKQLLKLKKLHYRGSSSFNPIIIVAETERFGKVLLLGDEKELTMQYSEKFDVYDEMLANVPMCIHPNPRKVLIIGGGDGGVLENVLRYETVKEAVLVEIDEKVVDVAKKFFKHGKVFEDPRVSVFYEDGAKYLEETNEKFDVIIGDYSDPYEGLPASTLIGERFYKKIEDRLNHLGIFACQSGSPIYQIEILERIYCEAKKIFDKTLMYFSPMPIYPGGFWSYVIGIKGDLDVEPKHTPNGTEYYNEQTHRAAFAIPEFLKKVVSTL
ncbi:MAG: fused MFS/spermidine synthase [Candidatus Njordarchaeia archaeon]